MVPYRSTGILSGLPGRISGEEYCYAVAMPVKTCVVTFVGPDDVEHRTEVQAESVYEAAAMALSQFREDHWSAEASHLTGLLKMVIKQPEVEHRVLLEKFYKFVEQNGGTLRQRTLRDKVKRIL